MKQNMGLLDRFIRIVIAFIFVGLYLSNTVTGVPGIILVVLGTIFVLTSIVSFCPLYGILGISSCTLAEKK